MNKTTPLKEIIDTLSSLDDRVFGRYAIENDLLYRKIKKEQYHELISKSIECGREYGLKIMEEAKSDNATEIAKYLGVKILEKGGKTGAKRLLFASFTTPNLVTIMKNPIEQTQSLTKRINKDIGVSFGYDNLYNILLSHEVFHFVENKYKKEIYTQTEKILLWELLGFENRSNLRVLSEIAAMSFAKTISGVEYSPFLLDVVLHYPYDKSGAINVYERILNIAETVQKEVGNDCS